MDGSSPLTIKGMDMSKATKKTEQAMNFLEINKEEN